MRHFLTPRARLLRHLADLFGDLDVLDLFAGPGGWDLAALELGLRVLGVEWDDAACATRRAAGLRTLQEDVAVIDPTLFAGVPGLIGSPPCPTFSSAGGGSGRHLTDLLVRCMRELGEGHDTRDVTAAQAFTTLQPRAWEDEQGKARKRDREPSRAAADARARRDADMSVLVVEPLRFALAMEPEWIALEQVPAVKPLWDVMAEVLQAHGYGTWCGVLEAERFGVPQTRERAVLVARLGAAAHPPEPTHHRYVPGEPRPEREEGLFGTVESWVSMAEALGSAARQNALLRSQYKGTTGQDGRTERGVGEPAPTVTGKPLGQWVVRTGNFTARDHRGQQGVRYERSLDAPAPTVTGKGVGEVVGLDRRQGGAPVRSLDEPAHTMSSSGLAKGRDVWTTGWPTMRPAPTVVGSRRSGVGGIIGRQLPPGEDQSVGGWSDVAKDDPRRTTDRPEGGAVRVTVEEAAVLQTFPIGYPWQGTRGQQFTQVGNAVPPLLAFCVLGALVGR